MATPAGLQDAARDEFDLVSSLLALGREPVSPSDRAQIEALIADTIAIAAYARRRRLGATASDQAAFAPLMPGPAAVWGDGAQVAPPLAAFLNGTAAEVLDFQEVMLRGRNNGHAAVVIVPALLGLAAGDPGSHARLLPAMRIAFTANLVLLEALGRGHRENGAGFRTTSLGAPVAAALGGAFLVGLDDRAAFHALAIAATSLPAGLLAALAPETGSFSSDKDLAVGFGARHAVDAVLLARAGATGPGAPLAGPRGWLRSFGFATGDAASLGGPIPRDALDAFAIKRYPANFGCQAAIRASIGLAQEAAGREIASVEICVKTSSAASLSTRAITNHLAARFSLAYGVASALVRRRSVLADFEVPALDDPAVASMMARCTVVGDVEMEERHRRTGAFPAQVTLRLASGEVLSAGFEGPWEGAGAAAKVDGLQAKLATLVPDAGALLAAVQGLDRPGALGRLDAVLRVSDTRR